MSINKSKEKVKSVIDGLFSKVENLNEDVEKIKKETTEKYENALKEVQQSRKKVSDKFDELAKSSEEKYDEVNKEFNTLLDDFKNSIGKLEAEVDKIEKQEKDPDRYRKIAKKNVDRLFDSVDYLKESSNKFQESTRKKIDEFDFEELKEDIASKYNDLEKTTGNAWNSIKDSFEKSIFEIRKRISISEEELTKEVKKEKNKPKE